MNILKRELGLKTERPAVVENPEIAFEEKLKILNAAHKHRSMLRAGIENGYAVNEEEFARATEAFDIALQDVGAFVGASGMDPMRSLEAQPAGNPPQGPTNNAEIAALPAPEPETPHPIQAESVPAADSFDIEFDLPAEMDQRAELTLDEIEQQYREAKSSGQTLEQAYWEKERDDFVGRRKAMDDLRTADRLEMEIMQKRQELSQIDPEGHYDDYMKMEKGIRTMESERKQLLKPGIARKIKNSVGRIFEKATFKAKERWREVPEPAKNMFTFGGWFIYETEKLRRDSKDASAMLQKEMEVISEERNMSSAAAQEEANMIQGILKLEGHAEPSPGDYNMIDRLVTERKRKENEQREDGIVAKVIDELKKKVGDQTWLAEYGIKNAGTLTNPENLRRIEQDIRAAIQQLREGQVRRDIIDYTKIIRRNLNQTWWRRVVYWGVDRAVKMFDNQNGL